MFCDKPVQRGSSKLGDSVITKGIKSCLKIAFSSGVGWEKVRMAKGYEDLLLNYFYYVISFFLGPCSNNDIYFLMEIRASFSKMEILSHHY